MNNTTLSIEGMSCNHCVRSVTEALKNVSGVTSAEVNLDAKEARVEHIAEVSPQSLIEAVEEEGYQATLQPKTA